jgi:arylsulfatase A-like enzyme
VLAFAVEPGRPFVVRMKLGGSETDRATAEVRGATADEASTIGAEPRVLEGEAPGTLLGPCIAQPVQPDGWEDCQRSDSTASKDQTFALLVIQNASLGARDIEVHDTALADPRAPQSPLLGPLVRRASELTARGWLTRTGLAARPEGRYAFRLRLPAGAELFVATGHEPGVRAAPLRFVAKQDGRVLLDEVVPPDGRSRPHRLPLSGDAGTSTVLTLEAHAADSSPGERRGLWLAPRVLGSSSAPSILLITVDALRADHLSAYGYRRDTSPVLEKLASAGVLFERATAQGGTTWLSMVSLLAGRYAARIGVRTEGNEPPPDTRLLADLLAERGYDTFAGGTPRLPSSLLASFDESEQVETAIQWRPGRDDLSAKTLAQVESLAEDLARRPTFAWLHLTDTHYPLHPSEPLRYNPGYEGRFANAFTLDDHGRQDETVLGARDPDQITALYDSACRDADALIGRMLAALEGAGALSRTIVVVTADHGTMLLERGVTLEHGFPHDAVLRVPLIIAAPERLAPRPKVAQRVQLIDLVPTLLALAKLPPEPDLDGRDSSPLLCGEALADRAAYAESAMGIYSRHDGDLHLVANPFRLAYSHLHGGRRVASSVKLAELELYDLATDPQEKRDLAAVDAARAAAATKALEAEIARWTATGRAAGGPGLGQDTLEALRQAGYLRDGKRSARGSGR